MTYDEFKAKLKVAKLSVRELAEILDMRPNSITNYRAKGEVPRHLAVIAVLMAEAINLGADLNHLRRRATVLEDSSGLPSYRPNVRLPRAPANK